MRRNSQTILLDVEVEEPQPAQVSFIDDKEQAYKSELCKIVAQSKHKKSFSFSDRVNWSSD